MRLVRKILAVVVALALVGAIVLAFLPKPLPVETRVVTRGPMVGTVDGEGRTRIKDRFVVSAPVAGQVPRLALHPGDRVALGATLVEIAPIEPPLLDARTRAQAEAQARTARAAVAQAKTRAGLAEATLGQARVDLERVRTLYERGGVAKAELEATELRARTAAAELESARFGVKIADFERETAEAALLRLRGGAEQGGAGGRVAVRAPVAGTVLRVLQESAGPVAAGAPLVELGDPAALEIVVDLLSSDAVLVRPGAEVRVERWGGEAPLAARVRIVEPAGFTKISALGIEEQRVNVLADLTGPPEAHAALGDGYRVYARVVVWQAPDAVQVPQSALFRRGDAWAAFVVAGDRGRARAVAVETGRRSEGVVEVRGGLAEGDRVVVHPSDKLEDGGRVVAR